MKTEATDIKGHLYSTFWVGNTYFGVDATGVQEILRAQPLTRVPLASAEVEGLLNLRGQVVTAIDLRRRLGMEPRESADEALNLVALTAQGPVSFLVDEIGDVLDADPSQLEPPPETIGEPTRGLVAGVHKLEDQLLLILDVARVAAPAES